MSSLTRSVSLGSVAIVVVLLSVCPVCSQQPTQIRIKVKVFNSDQPSGAPIVPEQALIFVRNQANSEPVFYRRARLIPSTERGEEGFYVIQLPPNELYEQIVIKMQDPQFNPALLARIVTRADMTVYPGASNSTTRFSFQAYTTQLSTYRTILSQLVDEYGESNRKAIQELLLKDFGQQVENLSKTNVSDYTPEQQKSAKKLLNDLRKDLGLPHEDLDEPGQKIIYVVPPRRCCLFGCFGR